MVPTDLDPDPQQGRKYIEVFLLYGKKIINHCASTVLYNDGN
jgi:hypothetical protein